MHACNFLTPLALMAGAVLLVTAVAAQARGRLIWDGPDRIPAGTSPLGDLIEASAKSQKPVHIVYVHGMRAEARDASQYMRARLEKYLEIAPQGPKARKPIDLGKRPRDANIAGIPLWSQNEEEARKEWAASHPFVDRYELRSAKGWVILDEVNWWPLLFGLKCRFLVVPEHDLSGNDRRHLDFCAADAKRLPEVARDPQLYHPWISTTKRDELLRARPRSGGGAWPNAPIKRQIMNWGLADAVIVLGNMRPYLVTTMSQAFDDERREVPEDASRVLVAESLGSFVVLDAMEAGAQPVQSFVDRSADVYFFANQFALLELARIRDFDPEKADSLSPVAASLLAREPRRSALAQLQPPSVRNAVPGQVKSLDERLVEDRHYVVKRVIAFNDPSDMLTWRVPKFTNEVASNDREVTVINYYTPISGGPFRLFADPVKAHRGAITDRAVWDLLLDGKGPR